MLAGAMWRRSTDFVDRANKVLCLLVFCKNAPQFARVRRLHFAQLLVTLAFLFANERLCVADSASVAKQTRDWRKLHEREILAEFAELLAIPNIAADRPNLERNATVIQSMFEKRGLHTQLLRIEGAPPIVVADLVAAGSQRTIAWYAHYDGQPVDVSHWKSDPWKPVMRDSAGHAVDWLDASGGSFSAVH